jgi:hypothetical protein
VGRDVGVDIDVNSRRSTSRRSSSLARGTWRTRPAAAARPG